MKKLLVQTILIACLLPVCVQAAAIADEADGARYVAHELIRSIKKGESKGGFLAAKCQLAIDNRHVSDLLFRLMHEIRDKNTEIAFNKTLTYFTYEDAQKISVWKVEGCQRVDKEGSLFSSLFNKFMMRDVCWSESGDSFAFYAAEPGCDDLDATWPTYTYTIATGQVTRSPFWNENINQIL